MARCLRDHGTFFSSSSRWKEVINRKLEKTREINTSINMFTRLTDASNSSLNGINPLLKRSCMKKKFDVINYYSFNEKALQYITQISGIFFFIVIFKEICIQVFSSFILLFPRIPHILLFLHPARSRSREASLNASSSFHLSFNVYSS